MTVVTMTPTRTWPSRTFTLLLTPWKQWDAEATLIQTRRGPRVTREEITDYRLCLEPDGEVLVLGDRAADGEVYGVTPAGTCSCPWGRANPLAICRKHAEMAAALKAEFAKSSAR